MPSPWDRQFWLGLPRWMKRATIFVAMPCWALMALMMATGWGLGHPMVLALAFAPLLVVCAILGAHAFGSSWRDGF
jgi:hypothetical protein